MGRPRVIGSSYLHANFTIRFPRSVAFDRATSHCYLTGGRPAVQICLSYSFSLSCHLAVSAIFSPFRSTPGSFDTHSATLSNAPFAPRSRRVVVPGHGRLRVWQPLVVGPTAPQVRIALRKAHATGQPVPQLITHLSYKFSDMPTTDVWEAAFEDSVVHVERVIAYWSRTFKHAELNYSATEREALGAKEGLVRFQPFIEGERVILVTYHAALQWAKTYENTNRRLAAWGAVFAAYAPLLDILHRAGRIHSNVDPLSRLPRNPPPHDSPVTDLSPPIVVDHAVGHPSNTLATTAKRATPLSVVWVDWPDVLESVPDGPAQEVAPPVSALHAYSTRSKDKVQAPTAKQPLVPSRHPSVPEPSTPAPAPGAQPQLSSVAAAPSAHLRIALSPEFTARFRDGYTADPFFRAKWEEAAADDQRRFRGQRFFRNEDGLPFFQINDEPLRLCVPHSEVTTLIARLHDSPFEAAHEGPWRLLARIAAKFYWPSLRKDVRAYASSCDVCQKIKTDHRQQAGLLLPNPVPNRPYEWVSLDLITGLPMSDGFDVIFVTVDRSTKHVQATPCLQSLTASGFAAVFLTTVVYRYGLPEHIIADRDPQWTSAFWRAGRQTGHAHGTFVVTPPPA